MLNRVLLCSIVAFTLIFQVQPSIAAPNVTVDRTTRCQICGMFIAKYPNWVALIVTEGENHYFDGVKDLLVFVFNSVSYGYKAEDLLDIWVKDYYSLKWLDGRTCFYVVGSDVYGPMGHEFIPFATKAAAENFLADHHGKEIITFSVITKKRVEAMRVGQKMR
jgi:nitrous oxide reductase accessory protein NosL